MGLGSTPAPCAAAALGWLRILSTCAQRRAHILTCVHARSQPDGSMQEGPTPTLSCRSAPSEEGGAAGAPLDSSRTCAGCAPILAATRRRSAPTYSLACACRRAREPDGLPPCQVTSSFRPAPWNAAACTGVAGIAWPCAPRPRGCQAGRSKHVRRGALASSAQARRSAACRAAARAAHAAPASPGAAHAPLVHRRAMIAHGGTHIRSRPAGCLLRTGSRPGLAHEQGPGILAAALARQATGRSAAAGRHTTCSLTLTLTRPDGAWLQQLPQSLLAACQACRAWRHAHRRGG